MDKGAIPYKFDMKIDGVTYTFKIKYNTLGDYFTVDLSRGENIVVVGEKVVYGKPLFSTSRYKDVPSSDIIPYDLSRNEERVSFRNFNRQVFLFMVGD